MTIASRMKKMLIATLLFFAATIDCMAANTANYKTITYEMEYPGATSNISVDFPVSVQEPLRSAIIDYILERLGTYKSDQLPAPISNKCDEETFKKVKVSPGGNGIEWDEERFIQTGILRKCGRISDICYEDINGFMIERLSDTAETMRMLNCSRQYVKQLADMQRIKAIRESGNTSIYSKGAIEAEL